MSNLTDALIAAKLVGGSGGSGGGSGLPEITSTESTVLETQTIAFTVDESEAQADLSIDGLEVGTEYSVTYDGVTYSGLVAKDYYGDVYLGNLAIWGETPDTEEPFIIQTSNGETYIYVNSTNPTHEVGIRFTVYTPANGSTLQVDGGEWKAVPSKGSELPKYGWQGAAIRWSNDQKWDAMPVAYILYMESSGGIEGYDVYINNPDVQEPVTFQTVYSLVHYNFMVPNIIMESHDFGHIVSIDEQASTITVRFEDANGPTFYILRADPDTGELHGYASQTN